VVIETNHLTLHPSVQPEKQGALKAQVGGPAIRPDLFSTTKTARRRDRGDLQI
jgi:hypothetical protein